MKSFQPILALFLLATSQVQGSIICFFLGTPRCIFGLGAVMRKGNPGEDTCEETCGLIFLAIFNFFNGYSCGRCSGLITPQENNPNTFHIDVFAVSIPGSQEQAFINAAATWADIITNDSGHGPFTAETLTESQPAEVLMAGCEYPDEVDDLFICAEIRAIDGGGSGGANVLGAAGPSLFSNLLRPVTGFMFFDEFDVDNLINSGTYNAVILHEMAHVIGVGTAWINNGLQQNTANCPFLGSAANREYRDITGCSNNVPTEPSSAGPGSGCSHWEESSCITNELMSSRLSPGSVISRITIGSLADIGYSVDYSRGQNLILSGNCCRRRNLNEHPRRKALSDAGTAKAVEFGLDLLAMQEPNLDTRDSDLGYFGIVSVLMMEDDEIYGVMVTRDGAI